MKIDCLAREPHHIKHAMAVWGALPDNLRGNFYTKAHDYAESENKLTLVSSYGDLKIVSHLGRKAIFMEHGIGLHYRTIHASYAGSLKDRECVVLRLSPNKLHAATERKVLKCPVVVVGVPKMDVWAGKKYSKPRRNNLTIAASFHFDATVCPETRSAWRYYIRGVSDLNHDYNVLGHAHPRLFRKLNNVYKNMSIKPEGDFEVIMRKADIYMCDNSSTIYEFAFLGKPIILLNSPLYRKNVNHEGNPRFWRHADIGYNVEKPSELAKAVEWTYSNWDINRLRQKQIVKEMFTFTDGKCAQRAVDAIIEHTQ